MRGGKNNMATSQKSPLSIKASESAASLPKAKLQFGREICGSLDIAEQREWLITNGIGGFASGTISGNLARRYHGSDYALTTNRRLSGAIEPKAYMNIEGLQLDGTTPIWRFTLGDALIEKRIWMHQGENTTYVQYTHVRGGQPVELELKALVN